ncbi:hypothetical protein CBI38_35010 (plasmid) [Rhodococcus oxybenzonivorans]|uniref:RES domain-containing protein n=1 Tax=Rhodococcus oxybenzonivorans TaxID=1990687 RepID=A0A2S2C7F1_9NOCA|nr:hypothetical protein CBI38_35010 [Rhodococcus oxybenzonivorans]
MFRCHGAEHGPLWFANAGYGRFDLADTQGTCYTAESEQITLLETWGGMRVIPSTELTARAVSRMQVTTDRMLADLTSNTAAQFGVTAEIFTTGNYQLTQTWASALHAAGFDGIRYWARHDLAHTHACLALFDTAGARPAEGAQSPVYSVIATNPLIERRNLMQELQQDTGITVLPIPHSL